jgi:predicted glutamine amidotransferase
MCQILILTKTDKVKDKTKLIEISAKQLQETQKDGFGYAIHGKLGVFGERTTNRSFKSRLGTKKYPILDSIIEQTYNDFGVNSNPVGGAIFHGRTSTNLKSLVNTHPISKSGWHLIHNGVVNNLGEKYDKATSNDTEDLIHYMTTTGIKGIEQNLSGYYAVGALDETGNLHIFKDAIANLHVTMNKTLDCLMFGTTEDLIKTVAKKMKYDIGHIEKVKDNVYMIFNPQGEMIANESISPKGYTALESAYMGRSLGYEADSDLHGYPDYMGSRNYKSHYMDDEERSYVDGYADDESAYQAEIDSMDASYTVVDWNGRKLDLDEFRKLDEVTKRDCIVRRADGTIVDCEDYYTERIA